jgi:hypothetical protein
MKLHATAPDDPYKIKLILSDYVSAEVDHLCQACRDLADRRIERFVLHDQPWIVAAHECQLILQYSEKDIGVRLPKPGEAYVLKYSEEAWLEVEGKLGRMREPMPHTWNNLTIDSEIPLIISPDGR